LKGEVKMKKLMFLTLVLGVASLATAGTVIVPGLEYDVSGSTLTITATTAVQTIGWSLKADDGSLLSNSTVDSALNVGTSTGVWNDAYLPNGLLGVSGSVGSAAAITGTVYSVDFASTASTIAFMYAQYTPSAVVFEGGATTYLDATYGSGEVMIVPEPVTMALLGLGGLFMARRKK
jgi:hypothetical protein